MKSLYLDEIVAVIGGTVVSGSGRPLIQNVVYRPSKVKDHTLLFYRYKDMAVDRRKFRKYASTAVVTDTPETFMDLGERVVIVKVDQIEEAYWKFVRYYRNLFHIPVIGITGTCGKTTTKAMVKHLLRKHFNVHSTFLSNNQRSLNLKYLLGIDEGTGAAVFEMPVASPGYLTNAIQYFQPQIRVLLNIDVYHLKDCKTPEAYMKAKAEIVHGLDPEKGVLILNGDDANIQNVLDVSGFRNVVYFGFGDGCHFRAKDVRYTEEGTRFTLCHQSGTYPVLVPGYGKPNVYNAMAAIAAASGAGMGVAECCERIASFVPLEEHLEFRSGAGGSIVIDDTWNAAPLSMLSALELLQEISGPKMKIAILGYMPQLGNGEYAREQYARVGEKAVNSRVDLMCVVGDEAKEIGLKALELGMDPNKVFFTDDGTEVGRIIQPFLNEHSVVLLKLPHRVMVRDSFKTLKKTIMT